MKTRIRKLLTVIQFSEKHPAFSVPGLRHYIHFAKENNFEDVVVRVKRRVLLDEEKFFEWIEDQQVGQ